MSENAPDNSNKLIQFDSREAFKSLGLELLQQAKRQICFFGPDINTLLFDDLDSLACISDFAKRSDKTIIKLVIQSSQHNVSSGHRLLPLAQKLTSSIKINTVSRQHQDLKQLFLLIDDTSYLYCPYNNRCEGRANFNDPAQVRSLQQDFNTIWEQSSPDITLRRLHL